MNIKPDCLSCLFDQALRVTKLLKLDDATSKKVFDRTAQVLMDHTMSSTPPQIARDIYQAISDVTGEKDPVALAKVYATEQALKIDTSFIHTIPDALKMAVIGNVIDFGSQEQLDLDEMIQYHVHKSFAIDDTDNFIRELQHAKEMVLLADNVGEHIFDKLLIETIKKHYDITVHYFVRGNPIINDVTFKEGQLLKDCAHIVDTGVRTPGFDLEEANSVSKEIFDRADIVLSKGMGNFESLYHVAKRPIYFLFVVKCSVVAEEIGQNIKELVFKRV
ncbi:MAG: ARMT1-like domain-containing protein [Candidatus Bathyarchaeota archaeon]|nr:ARMT1-like domain-containing protein [Candidatus Bathyarchaeota archaeon]